MIECFPCTRFSSELLGYRDCDRKLSYPHSKILCLLKYTIWVFQKIRYKEVKINEKKPQVQIEISTKKKKEPVMCPRYTDEWEERDGLWDEKKYKSQLLRG